jgi:hypothetical protein
MAACIRSKLVAFQTKSTEKPCVQSTGTPSFRLSSRQISSDTSDVSVASRTQHTVGNLDDRSDSFPHLLPARVRPVLVKRVHPFHPAKPCSGRPDKLQLQFVSRGEPQFPTLQLWHAEPGESPLVQTHVPSDRDLAFRLRFLHLLVVIRLDLDKGSKDVLILIGVFVPKLSAASSR